VRCTIVAMDFSASRSVIDALRRARIRFKTLADEAKVIATWLPFPSAELEPLAQVYRRGAERTHGA
jgi:hypothetical protein